MKTKFRKNYKAEADHIAAERGGRCLTLEIPALQSKAIWKCFNSNHPEWAASFGSVIGNRTTPGTWCDRCFRERLRQKLRLSIDQVRKRLRKLGFELMSKDYTGINDLISCRCLQCKNIWPTRLRHINHGHGCPECAKIKIAQKARKPTNQIVAALKDFLLTVVAVHYVKRATRVHFRCTVCNFENTANWNDLRRRGCPACGRKRGANFRKRTYDYIKNYLTERGILLLSKEYKGNKSKLHVRFPCGCEGQSDFNSLQSGRLCKSCAPNARVTLADYHQLATFHKGTLVEAAATVNQLAKWKCHKGHDFSRPYSSIRQSGTFCPRCSEGLSERICRAAAEQLFGMPFKKVKLRGVRGVGGRYLELDAYCEPLKLAIEHNGQQHYQPIRFGNQTEAETIHCFCKQQEHDRRRRGFCAANGITLIEVPELGRKIKIEDLKDFIRVECQKANFNLPESFDEVHLKLDAHHLATTAEEMWDRIIKRVADVGYTLLTANYTGANSRLSLLCCNNHPYTPRVETFLRGSTCRKCWLEKRRVSVVVMPLGRATGNSILAEAQVFTSIEQAAKAIRASPDNLRSVAKGRGNTCVGYGVAQITSEQAKCFGGNKQELESFCHTRWPSPENYDPQDGARKHNSKPIQFSDGRKFSSRTAAAKALGVTKTAIYFAVRTGSPCKGHVIQAPVTC